jgi:zinc-binding alcohol dehydrogenase family protein
VGQILRALVVSPFLRQKMLAFVAHHEGGSRGPQGTRRGRQVTPVIDRTYPLSETADAIHYVEEGDARGKAVVTVRGAGQDSA